MFSVVYILLLAVLFVREFVWGMARDELEETYTARREVVDRAEILGEGQAGEQRGGC